MHLILVLAAQILSIPTRQKPSESKSFVGALSRIFPSTCRIRVAVDNIIRTDDKAIGFDDIFLDFDDKSKKGKLPATPQSKDDTRKPDPVPGSARTFAFTSSPVPSVLFTTPFVPQGLGLVGRWGSEMELADATIWKMFKVAAAYDQEWFLYLLSEAKDILSQLTRMEGAFHGFNALLDRVDKELSVAAACPGGIGLGPEEHVVDIEDGVESQSYNILFPENLPLSFVKAMHYGNFYKTNKLHWQGTGPGFQVGTNLKLKTTIQIIGMTTFLFYTQLNLELAVAKYFEIQESRKKWQSWPKSKLPNFPLHPSVSGVVTHGVQTSDLLVDIPKWYRLLRGLNEAGFFSGQVVFPNRLMPLEVTVGPGDILVFDGSMVYATVYSEYSPSLALFA